MSRVVCTREIDPDVPCICPVCAASGYIVAKWLAGIAMVMAIVRGMFWLLGRLFPVAALLILASCVGSRPPVVTPSGPPQFFLLVQVVAKNGAPVQATLLIADSDNKGRGGQTNADGVLKIEHLVQAGFTICAKAEGFETGCGGVTLLANQNLTLVITPKAPPPPPIEPLQVSGPIFRTRAGTPWRYRGVSAFALLDRFAEGQDVSDTLNAYKGFNVLRVWPYVPAKDWGAQAWDVRDVATTRRFVAAMAAKGWWVELTLLTDDDPARLAWAQAFVPQLVAGGCPVNLLLEAGNEPRTHKAINTAALRGVLAASGCPYSSGDYEDSARFYGTYGTAHTARDSEWVRRAHDLMEFFNGGGPNAPSDPKHPVPWVADEPPKLQDVAANADDWRAYFGAVSLLGGGGSFHSETGKWGLPPTPQEAVLAAAALEGLSAFPADAPLGAYSRPVESSLRTYVVGPYMVRIRPTTPTPGAGWTRIGTSNVLWKR